MARARNIKPGFFKNEDLAELPADMRLLFIGLWTLADREGRMEDRPRRIKAELFPFDSFDIDPMLDQLQLKGFVVRYEVSDSRFLQVVNFVKHQDPHYKEKASEIPPPPGGSNLIEATGITRETRARIMGRDGYRCRLCGSEDYLSIDHIVPVSRGGSGEDANLQVLCLKCNGTKGNKLPGEQKGARRSKHADTSLKTRPNIDSSSNQDQPEHPGSVPLIPDSGFLIPDSPLTPRRGAPSRFSDFWAAWPSSPRKVGKAECEKRWKARGLDCEADEILAHVVALRQTDQWQRGFEPAPLTYLNQRRWEDGAEEGAGLLADAHPNRI